MDAKSWGFDPLEPSTGDKRPLPADTLEADQDVKRLCMEPCGDLIDYNLQPSSSFTSLPWMHHEENTAESSASAIPMPNLLPPVSSILPAPWLASPRYDPINNDTLFERNGVLSGQVRYSNDLIASDNFYDSHNSNSSSVPDLNTYHNTWNSNYTGQEIPNGQMQPEWWPNGEQSLQCAPSIPQWRTHWDLCSGNEADLLPQINIEQPQMITNNDFALQLPSLEVPNPESSISIWNSPQSSSIAPTATGVEDKSELGKLRDRT